MARTLDETFLQPHPETVGWWKMRAKCGVCLHRVDYADSGVRCAVSPQPGAGWTEKRDAARRRRRAAVEPGPAAPRPPWPGIVRLHMYCIDAREPDAPCGPDAKLFEPCP